MRHGPVFRPWVHLHRGSPRQEGPAPSFDGSDLHQDEVAERPCPGFRHGTRCVEHACSPFLFLHEHSHPGEEGMQTLNPLPASMTLTGMR